MKYFFYWPKGKLIPSVVSVCQELDRLHNFGVWLHATGQGDPEMFNQEEKAGQDQKLHTLKLLLMKVHALLDN